MTIWCISAGVRTWFLKTDGMSHDQSASYAQLTSIFILFLWYVFLKIRNLSYNPDTSSPAKNCQRKFSSDLCTISSVCFVCGRLCTCSAAKNCWSNGEANWKQSFSLCNGKVVCYKNVPVQNHSHDQETLLLATSNKKIPCQDSQMLQLITCEEMTAQCKVVHSRSQMLF